MGRTVTCNPKSNFCDRLPQLLQRLQLLELRQKVYDYELMILSKELCCAA